jgi:hypothetical protein
MVNVCSDGGITKTGRRRKAEWTGWTGDAPDTLSMGEEQRLQVLLDAPAS